MSGKFVRASKYRHVFGQAAKKELQYENVKVTNNAWDSNLIKTNGKFLAVNWNASGGGAFAVIPLNEVGKSPDQVPLFRGHTAQVLDTDFDPFNDRRLASGSDDSKIGIWDIPENYSFHNALDENDEISHVKPTRMLSGHSRKVGHVLFHPLAQNVLASSSLDYTVKLWDVESGENKLTLKHPDMVTSMSFSYDGNYLATVARDKKLRVWDIRANKIVCEGQAHSGAKNQRVVWLGNSDRIATTGFSKLSDRQIGIWDAFNLEKGDLGGFYTVDQSSGILMPFYDDSNKILYLAGKGDGNIRYYELQNDELFELSEYQSTEPQRGFAVAPKRTVNIKENEVVKGFKTVVDQYIEPVSFYVPRRSEEFQEDIYPDAPSDKPALSSEEWFSGKSVDGPILVSMRKLYEGADPTFHESKKAVHLSAKTVDPTPKSKEPTPSVNSETTAKKHVEPVKSQVEKKSFDFEPPKISLKENFKSDLSVNKMLQKSSDFDSENNTEDRSRDTSGWDEEDETPKEPEVLPMAKAQSKLEKEETIPRTSKSVNEAQEHVSEATNPSSEIQKSANVATSSVAEAEDPENKSSRAVEVSKATTTTVPPSAGTASTSSNTGKSLGLKQSVEKLSSLVQSLEQVVNTLIASNLEKDDRLQNLESKIGELIQQK